MYKCAILAFLFISYCCSLPTHVR
ncbi:hypothetical protein ZEAMMB73_Zm00001d051281 [Zea mays]|uniref:Uncharacterized protein n=1 Tax=Zea mays TaxID=4577 RepID=A0A1D6Q5Z1_MAIZE|nr:hypothetical protein ZEAMMB73_Zm00001d051281 [Zea mays]